MSIPALFIFQQSPGTAIGKLRAFVPFLAVAAALSVFLIGGWPHQVRAESQAPLAPTFSRAALDRIGDYVRNEVATGKIPGAVLLIQQHGKPVYLESFGERGPETGQPMTADTIFQIYSMSKAITSVAAMMLVDDGRLALDDPVSKYIHAFADAKVGVDLSWPALRELVDTGLGTKDLDSIRKTILAVSGVKALHLLRTRRVGGQALADVHIIVDDHLSVSEGHQISEAVRAKLINEITPMTDVMVHIDTEEDVEAPSCEGLPLRDEVLQRLDGYFHAIPEARQIEHVTLHYLDGHIDIDLLLPLSVVANTAAAQELARRFAEAVQGDEKIGSVDVLFH